MFGRFIRVTHHEYQWVIVKSLCAVQIVRFIMRAFLFHATTA